MHTLLHKFAASPYRCHCCAIESEESKASSLEQNFHLRKFRKLHRIMGCACTIDTRIVCLRFLNYLIKMLCINGEQLRETRALRAFFNFVVFFFLFSSRMRKKRREEMGKHITQSAFIPRIVFYSEAIRASGEDCRRYHA